MYIADGENFYFGLGDINNDDIQELLLSYRHGEEGPVQIHFPPSYECLMNVWGFDSTNNTYMVSQGSVCIDEVIYTYDGTSFSIVSSLEGEWDSSEDGSPYTVTENGTTREISKEEFVDLVEVHKLSLYRFAKSRLKNDIEVEDAISESILKKSWMMRIVSNECYDLIKRKI